MLFNSLEFLIFFPIVTLIYFIIPHKVRYLWLLGASYYFYMCWNPQYALLMAVSTFFTWLGGAVIERTANPTAKKAAVGLNFTVNLLILFFFKYFAFTVDNINSVLTALNLSPLNIGFDVILPVGISFYTFQALGYTMDVYRGDVKHEHNFLKYALFVSFFPQLVAGPIERSPNLLHQLSEKHTFNYDRMVSGLLLMLWGLFQKLVIADRAAILVNTVYGNETAFFGWHFAVATILFAVQIYCDFASYTTIARGAARVMGMELMENFEVPYFSRSIAEFWSRWHISLSGWFRDYLYIPLGGNRKGERRTYLNNFLTMVIGGLWHGASLMYVIWGAYHGLLLAVHKMIRKVYRIPEPLRGTFPVRIVNTLITFSLVVIGFTFFRAPSLDTVGEIFGQIFGSFHLSVLPQFVEGYMMIVVAIVAGLLMHFSPRSWSVGATRALTAMPLMVQGLILAMIIFFVIQTRQSELVPFIYLQY